MRLSTKEQRMAFRSKPANAREIQHPDGLGVVYVADESNGRPCFTAKAFRGTAGKPEFYFSYRTVEARDAKVAEWFNGLSERDKMLEERKSDRLKPHSLQVGEIIVNSWGYDQTNIDFYVIVKASSNFVWLQPIAQDGVETGFMCGNTWPSSPIQICQKKLEDGTDAPPTQHSARTCNGSDYVNFKYGSGNKWDGKPEHNSWYA